MADLCSVCEARPPDTVCDFCSRSVCYDCCSDNDAHRTSCVECDRDD